MTDPQHVLSSLRRPRLLVRAARLGLPEYNRVRSLRRLLPGEPVRRPGQAFERLIEAEAAIDHLRRQGSAAYSVARHIEFLVALIEESRLAACRMPRKRAA